jgi:hypothetical protein
MGLAVSVVLQTFIYMTNLILVTIALCFFGCNKFGEYQLPRYNIQAVCWPMHAMRKAGCGLLFHQYRHPMQGWKQAYKTSWQLHHSYIETE